MTTEETKGNNVDTFTTLLLSAPILTDLNVYITEKAQTKNNYMAEMRCRVGDHTVPL